MDLPLFTVFLCVIAVLAVWLLVRTLKKNSELHRINFDLTRVTGRTPAPWEISPARTPKSAEEQRAEHYERQLEAVIREHVAFTKRRVMNRSEYELFRAAMSVTRQPFPTGAFPFFMFPQVSLGQIIGTGEARDWQAEQAHRAINSKRCDLLIADRYGNPVAVLEYQGSGHNIDGTAQRRDEIKRIALERAGVRYMEIKAGTTPAEIQRTIRDLLSGPEKEGTAAHEERRPPFP